MHILGMWKMAMNDYILLFHFFSVEYMLYQAGISKNAVQVNYNGK